MIHILVQYMCVFMLVCVYLVNDVDGVLQQESGSLPLVVGVGVLSELLDLLFSHITEQHLKTVTHTSTLIIHTQSIDTENNGFYYCAMLWIIIV